MDPPISKASGFISMRNAIQSLISPEQYKALMRALPADTAALVERPPLPVEWLPVRFGKELLETAHKVAFDGNDQLVFETARRALVSDLKTIYRIFIRFLSPQYVIERGAKLYDTYTRHNGSLTVREIGPKSAELTYRNVVDSTPLVWVYQCGAAYGVLEATGLKDIRVEIKSGGGTSPTCVIHAHWG